MFRGFTQRQTSFPCLFFIWRGTFGALQVSAGGSVDSEFTSFTGAGTVDARGGVGNGSVGELEGIDGATTGGDGGGGSGAAAAEENKTAAMAAPASARFM